MVTYLARSFYSGRSRSRRARASTRSRRTSSASSSASGRSSAPPGASRCSSTTPGATGTACVQLARHLGATVFGTAGGPEKIERLRALGVEHPIDYRAEHFADAVGRLTGGTGVDVIVDSLSGDAIARGLAIVRPGGRFVEIGAAGLVPAGRPARPLQPESVVRGRERQQAR